MDAAYPIQQAKHLHGNDSGTLQSTTEITGTTDCPVAWDAYAHTSDICCMKFTPTRNSDNMTVSFTINISAAQSDTGNYWCAGIYNELPDNLKISNPGDGLYFRFGLNRQSYGDKIKSFTFSGDFRAGVSYWLVVGMASFTTKNTGTLRSPANIVLTATNVGGTTAFIWSPVSEDAHEASASVGFSAQQRYTSTNGANSGWAPANWVMPENTNNICGGGLNNTANGCLIPIPAADFAASSLTWRAKIYKSPSGVDVFRWAVTAASQEACAAYVNGKNVAEVTAAQDPLQLASGIFSPDWGAAQTGIFEMSIDFPAPVSAFTALNLVLWGTSQSYGNIHIQSAVTTFLRSVALSGMGWVPYDPRMVEGGLWQPYGPRIRVASDWGV